MQMYGTQELVFLFLARISWRLFCEEGRGEISPYPYRDFLGVLIKGHLKKETGPFPQIFVSESGPWSFQAALEIKALQKMRLLRIIKNGTSPEQMLLSLTAEGKEIFLSTREKERYDDFLHRVPTALLLDHIPWRHAVWWCYHELSSWSGWGKEPDPVILEFNRF